MSTTTRLHRSRWVLIGVALVMFSCACSSSQSDQVSSVQAAAGELTWLERATESGLTLSLNENILDWQYSRGLLNVAIGNQETGAIKVYSSQNSELWQNVTPPDFRIARPDTSWMGSAYNHNFILASDGQDMYLTGRNEGDGLIKIWKQGASGWSPATSLTGSTENHVVVGIEATSGCVIVAGIEFLPRGIEDPYRILSGGGLATAGIDSWSSCNANFSVSSCCGS